MNSKKLSIIVPCYNEAKNIPLILEAFRGIHKEQSFELVLVDNGSKDDSAHVFQKELSKKQNSFAKVVTVKVNQGYGHGILSGIRAAKGDILCWTHADMQTPPEDCLRVYKTLLESKDVDETVVKGKRTKRAFGEWFFTLGMSIIASTVLLTPLYDINAQPKLFSRTLFESLKNPPKDFSLDLYLLYVAKKRGYTLKCIPVVFRDRIHGESKWAFSFRSKVKTIWRTIKYIFKLRRTTRDIT